MAARRIKIRNKAKRAAPWVAAGTLAAYAVTGGGKPALAQAPAPRSAPAQPEAALNVIQFDIPGGPLDDVIDAFEMATGLEVMVTQQGILALHSPGVSGPHTLEMALKDMLNGTGVSYRLDGRTVTLLLAPVATGIEVTGDLPETANPRYTSPLRDLPQTITIIPRAVIEQQGATTLRDVVRNVPGLTITAGEGGVAAGDNLTLRGNSARNDIFIDGSRDLSAQSRDPFNMEQVEVTKGPTSAVSGRGSAGGTINLVSKTPATRPGIAGSFAVGNAGQQRATLDWNTPITQQLVRGTAVRLNLLWHESGVPGRNAVRNDRWGMAPALSFGLGTPSRLTLQHYKLKQDNISDYGIPWVPATHNALAEYRDQPAPVPRETFYGFRDRDRELLNQDSSTIRFEHDFSDSFTLRNQLRYGRAGRNSIATPPRFASPNNTVITREMRSWIAQDRIWDNQTDLRADFTTFGIRHAAVTGAAFTRETNLRQNRTAPSAQTTLLNPNPDDPYTGPITLNPFAGEIAGNTQAVWAFDTIRLGQRWEASGGLRWERFQVDGVNANAAPVQQTVRMTSVRAGLVYKPTAAGSIYGSYGTSLTPSLDGLSYSTANTSIPPEKTYTAEAGLKWELFGSRLLATGAAFRVAKDNARTPGLLPTDPPQVLAGQQVSQGFEVSVSGAVTRNLRLLGAYTFIDARINHSNNPAEVGKFFQNTPRHSASLWATYTADRFSVGIGPRAMSERFGNNTNTRRVAGYWTLDLMASYAVNRHLDVRLNLTNLNDAYYFDRLGGGHLIPGPARGVLLTTGFRF